MAEEGKIAVRNIRRDSNDDLKNKEKSSDITEDDLKLGMKKIQEITDKWTDKISEVAKTKKTNYGSLTQMDKKNEKKVYYFITSECIMCGICLDVCPISAIEER